MKKKEQVRIELILAVLSFMFGLVMLVGVLEREDLLRFIAVWVVVGTVLIAWLVSWAAAKG